MGEHLAVWCGGAGGSLQNVIEFSVEFRFLRKQIVAFQHNLWWNAHAAKLGEQFVNTEGNRMGVRVMVHATTCDAARDVHISNSVQRDISQIVERVELMI